MAFQLDWIELICPRCEGELSTLSSPPPGVDELLGCAGCGARYPVIAGIPDLRIFPDPYISIEGDRLKGQLLLSIFDRSDLDRMARTYYEITPETPPLDVEKNLLRLAHAVPRASSMIADWDQLFGHVGGQRLLEVGCGTAPLLAALNQRFTHRVGVDISFRWLVMARRRLADLGLTMPLVAACGEALPFRAGSFDAIAMDSYLEITRDQLEALRSARRVLRPGGRLLLNTPNRFSVGPDPHLGIMGGSYLPAPVVNAIARQRMARPPHRRLLGSRTLARFLRSAGFSRVTIAVPPVSSSQLATTGRVARFAGRLFNHARDIPGLRAVLGAIGPMLHADARAE